MKLEEKIKHLQKTQVKNLVKSRINEFQNFENKSDAEWFSEMCFCLLTANARAESAIRIQNQISPIGFLKMDKLRLSQVIKQNKHRFHNNKAKFIVDARKFKFIKNILTKFPEEKDARDFLVDNVKGLGMKEASHFLRNVGKQNLAILDRHILNLMSEENLIEIPKSLTIKKYLEIENKFLNLSKKLKLSPPELDLYMWYLKTGRVLK